MASSSPLSYQTTMPEYPDVSYQTWARQYGAGMQTRLGQAIGAWWQGKPDYNTWRTNEIDKYNASLSAYNTWLGTGAGIRASAESGDYNPSYFQAGNQASASPISYQELPSNSGFSEMAQGISGIFQFAQAIQSMKMLSEQVAGQKLKNEAQRITNENLPKLLQYRTDNLGFQADKRQYDLEALFYPRWSQYPDLWKTGAFSPYARGTYDLRDADRSFGYQRAVSDLNLMESAKNLRDSQSALNKASERDRDWFYNNVYGIQKEILEHSRDLLKGQYDFQKTEQNLRKAGIIAGISVNVINAAVNAIKTFINPVASSLVPSSGGSSSRGVDPFDMVDIFGSGF